MKKLPLLALCFLSAASLTGCSCANLFNFVTTRKNTFFKESELRKYHLDGLPSFKFESSYIKNKRNAVEGYFNVEEGLLRSYAKETFSYIKTTEYTYGALMDDGYMFGIPNIFDLLRYHDLHKNTQHLRFYQLYGDRYAFFYEVDDQIYEILIKDEQNTIDDKEYNFYMEVGPVKRVRWSSNYTEYLITDENKDKYISVYVEPDPDNTANRMITVKLPEMSYYRMDVYLTIHYTEFGEEKTLSYTPTLSGIARDYSFYFEREDGLPYEDGDLVVTGFEVSKESAFVTKTTPEQND